LRNGGIAERDALATVGEFGSNARNEAGRMETTSAELVLVPDEELQRLDDEPGPTSAEAQVLAQLSSQRLQDLQVYAS
jgi:hypothetical protein